jgi:hypothetical protein
MCTELLWQNLFKDGQQELCEKCRTPLRLVSLWENEECTEEAQDYVQWRS